MTRFTEDFDFTAMDEKFNKGEAWGDLSKSKKALEDGGESQDEYDFGALPCDDTKVSLFPSLSIKNKKEKSQKPIS